MATIEQVIRWICLVAGIAWFCWTLAQLVLTLLVPRPTASRIMYLANHSTYALFRAIARMRRSYRGRDKVLAVAAPAIILVQLVIFVVAFMASLALVIFGISDLSVRASFYQAGSTFLTLGVVEPTTPLEVGVTLLSALVGLVVVAMLIGYLLTLYSAYTERETLMTKLSLVAGEPAWGPEILCRRYLLAGSLHTAGVLEEWVNWVSKVRMSHTINPILDKFRSAGAKQNWVVSMTALMDAANLRLTTVKGEVDQATLARLLIEGTHALALLRGQHTPSGRRRHDEVRRDLWVLANAEVPEEGVGWNAAVEAMALDARTCLLGYSFSDLEPEAVGPMLTRQEWEYACGLLTASGLELVDDLDEAWATFSRTRLIYAPNAYAIAQYVYAVAAPWTGQRDPRTETVWPALAAHQLRSTAE